MGINLLAMCLEVYGDILVAEFIVIEFLGARNVYLGGMKVVVFDFSFISE